MTTYTYIIMFLSLLAAGADSAKGKAAGIIEFVVLLPLFGRMLGWW
jgi:hypothetical protein